jgi:hypothetical protein
MPKEKTRQPETTNFPDFVGCMRQYSTNVAVTVSRSIHEKPEEAGTAQIHPISIRNPEFSAASFDAELGTLVQALVSATRQA